MVSMVNGLGILWTDLLILFLPQRYISPIQAPTSTEASSSYSTSLQRVLNSSLAGSFSLKRCMMIEEVVEECVDSTAWDCVIGISDHLVRYLYLKLTA